MASAAFSPDGGIIAFWSDAGVLVECDTRTYKTLWARKWRWNKFKGGPAATALSFSPNNKLLAAGYSSEICLRDTQTGKLPHILEDGFVEVLAFSPDSATLASGGQDGNIILWDAQTGAKIRTLKLQHNSVMALAFAPDGATLAGGYFDGTVALWRIK